MRSAAILIGLAALAIFIFTPAAEEFARSPSFVPILTACLGGFALWSVAKGFITGSVEPIVRGTSWTFTRGQHPRRFWASMGWNAVFGGGLFFLSGQILMDGRTDALRDQCYDRNNTGSAEDRIAACDRLLADHPDDDRANVIASRGSAHFRLGHYRQAGADYAAAIRLNPREGSSQYNLGLVDEQLGDREHAIARYSAAISIDPTDFDAFENRGVIYLDSGRLTQAISDFTRAYGLDPTNVTVLANRGLAYARMNDPIHAEQDFAVVRKSDPFNLVVLQGEGLLATKGGKQATRLRTSDKTPDGSPTSRNDEQ